MSDITTAERLRRHIRKQIPDIEFFVTKEKYNENLVVVVPSRFEKATRQFVPLGYNGVTVAIVVIPALLDNGSDNRPSLTA